LIYITFLKDSAFYYIVCVLYQGVLPKIMIRYEKNQTTIPSNIKYARNLPI